MAKATSKDLGSAVLVTAVGAAALLFALRAHWSPQDLDPGVEGCLTVTIVAFLMALLHPLPYRQAVALCAPLAVAQILTVRYAAGWATGFGMAGIQLVVMGAAGIALSLREPAPAAAGPSPSPLATGRSAHAHS